MPFLDDVIDGITADISHIGLSEDGATEYAGGTYAHLAPTYGASAAGVAEITAALEFDGAANDGPITHLVFKKAGAAWVYRPVAVAKSFNSDGRIDVTSAPVTAAFPA